MVKQNSNYKITAPLPTRMKLGKKTYSLNLSFDRVIEFYSLFSKKTAMSYEDKIEVAYNWLVKKPRRVSAEEKLIVVHKINNDYLKMISSDKKSEKKQRTSVNFIADSRYIYAAFRQCYGIDLLRERGKLSWWEFSAMFDSLPDDCKMRQIMGIRVWEMPIFNGHNMEEITALTEQRDFYFLEENWEEIKEAANKSLSTLFDTLEKQAAKKAK